MKVPSRRICFFKTDDYLRSFLVVYLEPRSAWNFRIASVEERRWNRRRIIEADIQTLFTNHSINTITKTLKTMKWILCYMYSWVLFSLVCQIAKRDYQLRHVCFYACLSIRLFAGENCLPLDGLSWNLLSIFLKCVKRIQDALKSDKNNMYVKRTICTVMIISRWIIRMRNVADRFVEEIKTHMLCPVNFLFQKIVAFMR
jgi:hypothetical protein